MAQLGPYEGQFRDAGAELIFIAAEKREGMFKPEEFLRKHPTAYPFLLDEDRKITKLYGVYHRAGIDAINIARPATFVVGQDGIIRYIFVGSSQTDRAPVDEVLRAVRDLKRQ
jgi:peroxiredoxin